MLLCKSKIWKESFICLAHLLANTVLVDKKVSTCRLRHWHLQNPHSSQLVEVVDPLITGSTPVCLSELVSLCMSVCCLHSASFSRLLCQWHYKHTCQDYCSFLYCAHNCQTLFLSILESLVLLRPSNPNQKPFFFFFSVTAILNL